MDGIDVALVETDGVDHVRAGPGATLPYPASLRGELGAVISDPAVAERDPLTALEEKVTDAFIEAVQVFASVNSIDLSTVDLIGMHGQTVCHRPEKRFTRQLGLGARMAAALGVDVVDGFRQADVESGGHGAPFAPLYHAALVSGQPQPLVVLNLGGVGNVTYVDGDTIIAFDTGPASALIDDFVATHFNVAFDEGGRIASRGTVDAASLSALMDNPYFSKTPPKSLDRQDFHARAGVVDTLSPEDAVATLTAFTVAATAAAVRHMPKRPLRWLVCGGGRRNRLMINGLSEQLGVPVEPVEVLGWNGDTIEAELFGYLAVRSVKGLPLSLPTTTGVPYPMPGGRLHKA